MHYVDLHTHVLPGLDDGAPDAAASNALIAGVMALGFSEICATPHQKSGQFLPSLSAIAGAYATTTATHSAVCHLGVENMWDDVFLSRAATNKIPSYDNGPAFLFELPLGPALPPGLADQLFRFRTKGRLPVMAHPERYTALTDLDVAKTLSQQAAFVLDLGAIAGGFGAAQKRSALALLHAGLAHAVTTDAHSMADVELSAAAIAWLKKQLGEKKAQLLLAENPRAILAGHMPDPVV